MELNIRALGLHPTPAFKHYVARRLRHALRSFDIDRVTVRLIRDHGRGRQAAHRCQVAVSSHGLESLRVNEEHGLIRVACARAANQTRRALVRLVHRARRLSRAGRGAPIWYDVDDAGPHATPHPLIPRPSRVEPLAPRGSPGASGDAAG